jgi:hypothetical protein
LQGEAVHGVGPKLGPLPTISHMTAMLRPKTEATEARTRNRTDPYRATVLS